MFVTNTALGGAGFSVGSQGYIKYATGYPLTLEKTLAKPPKSITVFGNSGGVGDYDSTKQAYKIPISLQGRNLFNKDAMTVYSGKFLDYSGTLVNANNASYGYIPVEPQTRYTLYTSFSNGFYYRTVAFCDSDKNIIYYDSGRSNTHGTSFEGGYNSTYFRRATFTTPSDCKFVLVSFLQGDRFNTVQLYKGAYTINTIPNEPYINKTINLYSDSVLGVNESLTVKPKTHEATKHDDTSVAGLQDWEQDFTIPKADELTVTAGTEVEPGEPGLEIAYYSSERE